MTLLLSGDSRAATIDDIRAIPMPTATRTYQPVSHEQLSNMLVEMAENLLPDFGYDALGDAISAIFKRNPSKTNPVYNRKHR